MRSQQALSSLIEIIFSIVEFFLVLRFVLKLFGANPATPFTNWVYTSSEPLLAPFGGIFPSSVLQGRFTLDFSTLFALIIYSLISYFLLDILAPRERRTILVD